VVQQSASLLRLCFVMTFHYSPLNRFDSGISLDLDATSHQHQVFRKRKFEPERESKTLLKVPQAVRTPIEDQPTLVFAEPPRDELYGCRICNPSDASAAHDALLPPSGFSKERASRTIVPSRPRQRPCSRMAREVEHAPRQREQLAGVAAERASIVPPRTRPPAVFPRSIFAFLV
jgi:hypothetical protein